jgi:2-amino-4-hydroxy-6-hydroxymethyldihydropteridine diphosphokinase
MGTRGLRCRPASASGTGPEGRALARAGRCDADMPHRAFIGIGSNLGDRKANYLEAIDRIQKLSGTRIVKQSSLYESEPLGDAKTWFVNAVIEIETEAAADDLLKRLKAIESTMGRKRVRGKRWGSRIIDLDILFFDSEIINKRTLKVPHPELQNRRFVLAPLSELAPQFVHPKLAQSVSELLAGLKDTKKIHLLRA